MTAVAIIEASTSPTNEGDSDVALAAAGDIGDDALEHLRETFAVEVDLAQQHHDRPDLHRGEHGGEDDTGEDSVVGPALLVVSAHLMVPSSICPIRQMTPL